MFVGTSIESHERSPRQSFHWAWIVLAICFIDFFVNYSIRNGFGVILPEMIRSLGLNRTQGGTIFNFYFAAYICLTPLTGTLTDRLGARRVITLFSVLLGIGPLLMGTVESFWTACIFFAIAGAGSSAMWTPVVTVVQKWFAPRKRGMALGLISIGPGLGYAIIGYSFPLLVNASSWRLCWYVVGAFALIMVLLNGLFLRSGPEDLGMPPWGERSTVPIVHSQEDWFRKTRYREVFRSSRFWIIGASYFFMSYAVYTMMTFMVDYANMELGFAYKNASFLATIHGLSQLIGVLTIPILSDRIGRRITLMGTNMLIALSILGIIASGKSLWGLYASIGILGIAYGAIWPLYGACGGDYFKKEVIGTVTGAWTPLYGLGAVLAHFIGGRIRDMTGSYQVAFYLAMVFAAVAAFLMLKVRTPHGPLAQCFNGPETGFHGRD
jgi:sugar phosphate permease